MEEINNQNSMEQQTETQPAATGDQGGEKLFTQEDVNRIIKERLDRERSKFAHQEQAAAEDREKALASRESRLSCREFLMDRGYPAELVDLFDTSDPKEFGRKVEIASRVLGHNQPAPLRSHEPADGFSKNALPAGFERAKYEPKQFPPRFNE